MDNTLENIRYKLDRLREEYNRLISSSCCGTTTEECIQRRLKLNKLERDMSYLETTELWLAAALGEDKPRDAIDPDVLCVTIGVLSDIEDLVRPGLEHFSGGLSEYNTEQVFKAVRGHIKYLHNILDPSEPPRKSPRATLPTLSGDPDD